MTKKFVWVTTQFEGFHRWKDAPDNVAYLRDYHRHIFHVVLTVEVAHSNRDIEFIQLKDSLNAFLVPWVGRRFEWSCEQLAEQILNNFDAKMVEVSEDGENGASVVRSDSWEDAAMQYAKNCWGNIGSFPPAEWVEPNKTEQLVSEQLRKFCFVGVEAEGPNKGAYVLFVPGSCTPIRFAAIMGHPRVKGIERIYYGAGNDRQINYEVLNLICETAKVKNIPVDVETDQQPLLAELVAQSIKWGFNILQYVPGEPPYTFDKRATFFKTIHASRIRWTHNVAELGNRSWVTPTDHPLFSFDIPLEEIRGSFFSHINR